MGNKSERFIRQIFNEAGIEVNGNAPWDPVIHDTNVFQKVVRGGSLALGESYVEGLWDVEALDKMIAKLLQSGLESRVKSWKQQFTEQVWSRVINLQSKLRAQRQGGDHYNLGDDLFRRMLGRYMVYSCAFWRGSEDLDMAQRNKMALICEKLQLEEGDHLLDIGCGWGELARFAAEEYGARVTGVTLSKNQAAYGKQICSHLEVDIRVMDYRDLKGKYDKVVSVGMFEHVGSRNYKRFMQVARSCMKDNSLFLLHTIGGNISVRTTDPWLDNYIFPGSQIPSLQQIASVHEGLLVCEDWHNFGPYYDKTLMAWHTNFNNAWSEIKERYGSRFRRMWNYYLLVCAASFRVRKNHVWQYVFSGKGLKNGYISPGIEHVNSAIVQH